MQKLTIRRPIRRVPLVDCPAVPNVPINAMQCKKCSDCERMNSRSVYCNRSKLQQINKGKEV